MWFNHTRPTPADNGSIGANPHPLGANSHSTRCKFTLHTPSVFQPLNTSKPTPHIHPSPYIPSNSHHTYTLAPTYPLNPHPTPLLSLSTLQPYTPQHFSALNTPQTPTPQHFSSHTTYNPLTAYTLAPTHPLNPRYDWI